MHSRILHRGARSPHSGRPRAWHVGLLVALLATILFPTTSMAQTDDDTDDSENGDYVTTTLPERSLDVTAFSPECIRDAPWISYSIVPVGFEPETQSATLVIKDRNGNVIETRTVNSLSGSFVYPGASVDGSGNPTDWPGWKIADDGVSWIPDPSDAFLREGLIIDVTVNPTATATVSYPPATSTCAGPPEEPSLDVTAFAPVCISDAPFIEFNIVPIGFSSSGPATLTFYDRNGAFVEQRVVNSLSGRTIYPGAAVDANGNPTDWPGWQQAADGSWIPDQSDAILRQGLRIEVEVNPTATASVTYPPATAACNGPDDGPCVPGEDNDGETGGDSCDPCVPGDDGDDDPSDDCDPCVPGEDGDDNPADDCDPCVPGEDTDGDGTADDENCRPCYPGQNNDDNPADDCTLPRTGGGSSAGQIMTIGALALLAGLVFMLTARRKRATTS